jgi:uncharacterized membrane protein YhhN
MLAWFPVPFVVASLLLLLRAERAEPRDIAGVRVWKPAATVLVIACCLLSLPSAANPVYTMLIAIGLCACLIGDVFLIDGDKPGMFLRGVGAFLVAHSLFFAALMIRQQSRGIAPDATRELVAAAIVATLVGLLYVYMRDALGPYKQSLLIYMAVIGVMLHRAVIGIEAASALSQPNMVALGAGLFVVSDTILALNKFMFTSESIQPAGDATAVLTTYYAAITLFALSCSF